MERDNQGISTVSPRLLLLNEIIKIHPLRHPVLAKKKKKKRKIFRQYFHLTLDSTPYRGEI